MPRSVGAAQTRALGGELEPYLQARIKGRILEVNVITVGRDLLTGSQLLKKILIILQGSLDLESFAVPGN